MFSLLPGNSSGEKGGPTMRILVVEMSNLGDALLTYPALYALWAAYPDAEFHLLAYNVT